jgi:hypothetical protein
MKKYWPILITLIILSSCARQDTAEHKQGIISIMLHRQAVMLQQTPNLAFHKVVNYDGKSVNADVTAAEVIRLDSTLWDLNPDKLMNNTGFEKRITTVDGLTELKLTRKPDESSPFKLVDCYYYQTGDSITWKAMYVQQEDKNMLFHSIQSYILDFNAGRLTDMTMHTFSKTTFGKMEDFRVDYMIREK